MSGLSRFLNQKFHPPKETSESFAGRTVLITGATGGLGLEAAKKFAALDASTLILTARDPKRGATAKTLVQEAAKAASSGTQVDVLELDMSAHASVKSFVAELKSKYPVIDTAILNAGCIHVKYSASADGWEQTMQVNTISTVLLALLLLPQLEESATPKRPARLTFISSGMAVFVKPENVAKFYDSPNALRALSAEKNFPGGSTQYGISKLLLEYAMRHIAALPGLQGKVLVNSACPGMCRSDLGRQYVTNPIVAFLVWIMYTLFARTAEQGSNVYLSAVTRGEEGQGQLWKEDRNYEAGVMMKNTAFGEKIWGQLVEVMEETDPSVKAILQKS